MTLTMPDLRPPTTCGSDACDHAMCLRWREQTQRRCSECFHTIAAGEKFVEYRNPISHELVDQRHYLCPEVSE